MDDQSSTATTSSDIVHRPAHSLDTIATLCEGCDGYWPCEQAGHTGFYWDRGQGDAEDDGWMWVCHDSCPHRSHIGRGSDNA